MIAKSTLLGLLTTITLLLPYAVHAGVTDTQQLGARGQVQRMIVNSNADNDQIYLTATGSGNRCFSMTLQTNDPNVSATSFKTLYAYLLTAKATGKTLEFYTDPSCRLFRLEMVD